MADGPACSPKERGEVPIDDKNTPAISRRGATIAYDLSPKSYAPTAAASANFVSIFAAALKKSWIDWLNR